MTPSWPDRYEELAAELTRDAPGAGPYLLGFNACIDAVWSVEADVLARIGTAARAEGLAPARRMCAEIVDRIVSGRGGEIFLDWPDGPAWWAELLPEPDRRQVGGTGPQAAWTLAELGARCIVPLADRSPEQVSVLHPGIDVVTEDRATPIGEVDARGGGRPGKPAHHILEFTAGTPFDGGALPRSTRLILRFAADGIERDDGFAALPPKLVSGADGAVISGLNGIPRDDRASWVWMDQVIDAWSDLKLPHVHLELAEYPSAEQLHTAAAFGAGRTETVGLSLSELRMLTGGLGAQPAEAARALAATEGYDAVIVHADQWSLAVHRADPDRIERRLLAGNLLASVRAAYGRPQARLGLPTDAILTDDRPIAGPIGAGWHVTCVPSPWLRTPRSTIGLGDSFVAGLLLGAHAP